MADLFLADMRKQTELLESLEGPMPDAASRGAPKLPPLADLRLGHEELPATRDGLETERRLRHNHHGQLDYDDSLVPGKIVAGIMHLGKVTDKQDEEIGLGTNAPPGIGRPT